MSDKLWLAGLILCRINYRFKAVAEMRRISVPLASGEGSAQPKSWVPAFRRQCDVQLPFNPLATNGSVG